MVEKLKVVNVLRLSKQRIEKPQNWCTEGFAKDSKGNPVDIMDEKASCWCTVGSVRKTLKETKASIVLKQYAFDSLDKAAHRMGFHQSMKLNDAEGRTFEGHANVMKMFDLAIQIFEDRKRRTA